MKSKPLFFASLAVVLYLLLLYINGYVLNLDYVLLGALQEMLTIPVLILQVVLLVVTTLRIAGKEQPKGLYVYGSFSLLSVSLVFVVGSFFSL